ncbi:MAG: glycerophosphodiester phosphodiesterase family protein [Polyangia bacterium]
MKQGADGVELDVMRCGSGEVVVVHDDDLQRLAPGQPGAGQLVRQMSLGDLRRFDVGRGERIPTLEEVFLALADTALVNVELKSPTLHRSADYLKLPFDDGLAAAVGAVLRRCGRLDPSGRTLISSFDPFQLLRFQTVAPGLPLGYLFEAGQGGFFRGLHKLPLFRLSPCGASRSQLLDGPSLRAWKARRSGASTPGRWMIRVKWPRWRCWASMRSLSWFAATLAALTKREAATQKDPADE